MSETRRIDCASGVLIHVQADLSIYALQVRVNMLCSKFAPANLITCAPHSSGEYYPGEAREIADLIEARLERRKPASESVVADEDEGAIFSARRWDGETVTTTWGTDRFTCDITLTNAEAAELADALRWAAAQVEPAGTEDAP